MYEAHQMGKDSKGQPVIGVFEDGVLVARLDVERIAGLYAEVVALNKVEVENE